MPLGNDEKFNKYNSEGNLQNVRYKWNNGKLDEIH